MRVPVLRRPWFVLSTFLAAAWLADAVPKPPSPAWMLDQMPPGEAFFNDPNYNSGAYGAYVNRTFKSSDVIGPRIYFEKPFSNCDDGSYIFVTPRGEHTKPNPVILDANGSLVWTPGPRFGQVYNLQVAEYKGKKYVVFWSGNNSVGGHGAGAYFMFDENYQLVRTINGTKGYDADLHSFTILPDGKVLLTSYEKAKVDPKELPPSRFARHGHEAWVWDAVFLEFDMETDEIAFEWRSREHFAYAESYNTIEKVTQKDPWDWFHINTVEKDDLGNYLICARHLRVVAYISGKTGEVLWRLGGKQSSFTDLSNGDATRFVGQHDTHWAEGHKYITLFDNRADWQFEQEHVSKASRIEVDLDKMTAKLDHQYIHPLRIFAFSQGSYQTLPNGNVLVGYGFTGAFTEFAPDGTVLCDAYLGPSSRFSSGDVQSYRNLKFNWTGIPLSQPSVVMEDNKLYVSWHGTTETRSWQLVDSFSHDGPFLPNLVSPKTGFETIIDVGSTMPLRQYIRLVALDKDGNVLSSSIALDIGNRANAPPDSDADDDEADEVSAIQQDLMDVKYQLGFFVLAMIAALVVFSCTLGPRLLRGWRSRIGGARGYRTTATRDSELTFWQRLWSRLDAPWREKVTYTLLGSRGSSEESGTGLLYNMGGR